MAIDTHLKFDGVEGESQHQDHKGEIDVLSWSWAVHNDANTVGTGTGQGKAQAGHLHFSHQYDKASPVLAKKCAQGVHFKEVLLTSRKSGEKQQDFLKVKFSEVYITKVEPGADSTGMITENVAFSYAEIEFAYKPQDETGKLGGEVKFAWNNKTTKIA
jgi:type VI secretion system secreted protein Hcp